MDDGSTDPATVQLLDGYERPRTTVYRTPNQGLAAARNFLIARARGEYLCALDADDKLHPQYLERTLAALEHDPSLGFASTKMQMFGLETRVWPEDTRCDLVTLLCHDPVHPAALVRRSAVLAVGGYDQEMPHQGNEDWDLWIGLIEAGYGGVILDEVLFFYRRRENSMSGTCARGDAQLQAVAYLMRKHAASYRAHESAVAQWKDAAASDGRAAQRSPRGERVGHVRHGRPAPPGAGGAAATVERRGCWGGAGCRRQRRQSPSRTTGAVRPAWRSADEARRAAAADAAALRASLSWQVTAPLRAIYDAWRAAVGSRHR